MNKKNCYGLIIKISERCDMQKGEIRIEISKDLVKWYGIALGKWLRITILAQLIYSGSHYGANSLNCQFSWTHESNY